VADDERSYVQRWLRRWVGPSGPLKIYRPPFDEGVSPNTGARRE
jgi:hypothetical protein